MFVCCLFIAVVLSLFIYYDSWSICFHWYMQSNTHTLLRVPGSPFLMPSDNVALWMCNVGKSINHPWKIVTILQRKKTQFSQCPLRVYPFNIRYRAEVKATQLIADTCGDARVMSLRGRSHTSWGKFRPFLDPYLSSWHHVYIFVWPLPS